METKAKYPISDNDLLALMHKYPFLRHRNVFSGKLSNHGKSHNLKYNHYREFDGAGWERIWKTYLKHLFKEYDSWDRKTQKQFAFLQIKEKYGTMRIYTSLGTVHEQIAEMLSRYTCFSCGKEPRNESGERVIWLSKGYILPYCKECAEKDKYEEYETDTLTDGFSMLWYNKDGHFRIPYTEKDGWLEEGEPIKIDDKE